MLTAFVLALFPFQDPKPRDLAALPALLVGESVEAELTAGDEVVRAKVLDGRERGPTVARSFRIAVDEAGAYHVDLRSHFFDAYLVLRDAEGELLAKDDNGLLGRHARIVHELASGTTYVVEACGLGGGRGAMELTLRRGTPPVPSPEERLGGARMEAEAAVEARKAKYGSTHREVAEAWNVLGGALLNLGDYRAAQTVFEEALAIREQTAGPEAALTAQALSNLGVAHRGLGDVARTAELCARAVAIAEKTVGPESTTVATYLINQGSALHILGDLDAAGRALERAVAIREKVLGPRHRDTGKACNDLARIHYALGNHRRAESLFRHALSICEETLGPAAAYTGTVCSDLGLLLDEVGDQAGSRELLERSLRIFEQALGKDHIFTADVLNNLGVLHFTLNDLDSARRLLERSLETHERALGPSSPKTAYILNNLGLVATNQGDFERARSLLERALAVREAALGPEHPLTAQTLSNLAILEQKRGDPDAALELMRRAVETYEKSLGPGSFHVALGYHSIANILDSQGDPENARVWLERSLTVLDGAMEPGHPWFSSNIDSLARVLYDLDAPDEARELLDRYEAPRRRHRLQTLASMTEGERYAYLAALRSRLDLRFSLAEEGGAHRLYEQILDWKGQVARLLVLDRERVNAEMPSDVRASVAELRACQQRLSSLTTRQCSADPGALEERLRETLAERQQIESRILRTSEPVVPRKITPEVVAGGLPPGSVLLDFFLYSRYVPAGRRSPDGPESEMGLSVWVLRHGETEVVWIDLGPVDPMIDAVADHVGGLLESTPGGLPDRGVRASAESPPEASALLALLWHPIRPHLQGCSRVFVSPDGFLGTLPFGTLRLEDGSYALESYAFVYAGDALSLKGGETAGVSGSLLTVGDVDFVRRAAAASGAAAAHSSALREGIGRSFPPLPATGLESRAVSELHRRTFDEEVGRILLEGRAATEERIKAESPKHSVLHLATHGFFQPEGMPSSWEAALAAARGPEPFREAQHLVGKHPGLLSGLVCAGATAPADGEAGEDGFLTAEEVSWLDLSGVELVVLSACETGLGRSKSGEGLIGLRRAFHTAGARTVISSLWNVQDESTAELMRDFYTNLWVKKMGRLESLRHAQLEMLNKNRTEHGAAQPATWGAFVLSGEWH